MTQHASYPRPELLIPAGNPENLRSALLYGADAVYLGGKAHNLRASSSGFNKRELFQAVSEAEAAGAKVYYCLNSLARQDSLATLPAAIEEAALCQVHAFIVADPGVIRLARRYAPEIPLHLSTQANTSNSESVAFWRDLGIARVNLARELTCPEIRSIRRSYPDMELEVFVHGAMCLALSGHCLLSAWLNHRSGNQGRCTQPCQFEYRPRAVHFARPPSRSLVDELLLEEKKRPDEETWRLREEGPYTSFFAPEDLCLLPYLPWLLDMGVDSLKIEGRMKSSAYVAHVADIYSTAVRGLHTLRMEHDTDAYALSALSDNPADMDVPELLSLFNTADLFRDLLKAAGRSMGTGFFLPDRRIQLAERPAPSMPLTPQPVLARVGEQRGPGAWSVDVRSNWDARKPIVLMLPGFQRPVLPPGEYGLENDGGEGKKFVGNGGKAVLKTADARIVSGMFIRAFLPASV